MSKTPAEKKPSTCHLPNPDVSHQSSEDFSDEKRPTKIKHHFWWGNLFVLCWCISIETHSIIDEQRALRAQETVPTLHQDRVHRHVFALSC